MIIKEAIVIRFKELCEARKIKFNELATLSGVTPSTVYSMMDTNRKDVSINTIKKLCDGLDICVIDFFNSPVFKELEQEIS